MQPSVKLVKVVEGVVAWRVLSAGRFPHSGLCSRVLLGTKLHIRKFLVRKVVASLCKNLGLRLALGWGQKPRTVTIALLFVVSRCVILGAAAEVPMVMGSRRVRVYTRLSEKLQLSCRFYRRSCPVSVARLV